MIPLKKSYFELLTWEVRVIIIKNLFSCAHVLLFFDPKEVLCSISRASLFGVRGIYLLLFGQKSQKSALGWRESCLCLAEQEQGVLTRIYGTHFFFIFAFFYEEAIRSQLSLLCLAASGQSKCTFFSPENTWVSIRCIRVSTFFIFKGLLFYLLPKVKKQF